MSGPRAIIRLYKGRCSSYRRKASPTWEQSAVSHFHRAIPRTIVPALAFAFLTCTSNTGPSSPEPTGGPPSVTVDLDFGEAPLTGTLHLVPAEQSADWRYRVEAIPSGILLQAGSVEGSVAIPYRFEVPGIHFLRVELTGPEGDVVVQKTIVVVDPESDFEILAQRAVDEIWPEGENVSPEGIVMDPAGRWLYAAQYRSGELVRIDPATLEVESRVVVGPQLEGLAVDPTGDRLFGIHKNAGFSVVDLASFTSIHLDGFSGFYIEAMGASHALIGGNGLLGRVNVDTHEIHWADLPGGAGHFAVFPDGDRIVSFVYYPSSGVPEESSLEILSLPGLAPIHSIPLVNLLGAVHLAVDPSGDAIYALGQGDSGVRFLALDPATGEVVASMSIAGSVCGIYCVANPVVTFASGRYIAFERGGAVIVVDTELDLPRYRFNPGGYDSAVLAPPAGVAAHPDSDVLYVLGPAGRLFKIRLRNP
jgi:DNA-binding beta-propeller fold protein YncE